MENKVKTKMFSMKQTNLEDFNKIINFLFMFICNIIICKKYFLSYLLFGATLSYYLFVKNEVCYCAETFVISAFLIDKNARSSRNFNIK